MSIASTAQTLLSSWPASVPLATSSMPWEFSRSQFFLSTVTLSGTCKKEKQLTYSIGSSLKATYGHNGPSYSSQISQWLLPIPPWLLISARSSHFCHCSVYNLLLHLASVTVIFSNKLATKYFEFGEPLVLSLPPT